MPFVDDLNRILRDHEGYTGDGHGGNGALPVGDRSTARKPISKRDLREILLQMAQTMGDPSALQDILDELDGKADLQNSGKFFTSRDAAVAAGQANLPGNLSMIVTVEGDWIVFRSFNNTSDDPLFQTQPSWGVSRRAPNKAIIDAIEASKADLQNSGKFFTSRSAAVSAGQDALPGSLSMIVTIEGNWVALRRFDNTTDDPLFTTQPSWGVARLVPAQPIISGIEASIDLKADTSELEEVDQRLTESLEAIVIKKDGLGNLVPLVSTDDGEVPLWLIDGDLGARGMARGLRQSATQDIATRSPHGAFTPLIAAGDNVIAWLDSNGAIGAPGMTRELRKAAVQDIATQSQQGAVTPLISAGDRVIAWVDAGGRFRAAGMDSAIAYAQPRVQPYASASPAYTDGRSLHRIRQQIGKLRAGVSGQQAKIALWGDSWSEMQQIMNALRNITLPVGDAGGGFVDIKGTYPISGASISTSGWTLADASINSDWPYGVGPDGHVITTTTTAATLTATLPGDMIRIYSRQHGGTWRYRVDGAGWSTVTEGSGGGLRVTTISGLSYDPHTLEIDTTGNAGTVSITGIYLPGFSEGVQVIKAGNAGLTGYRLRDFAELSQPEWGNINPDLVVLILGTNDYRNGYSTVSAYVDGLHAALSTIRAAAPGAGMVIVAPPQSDGVAVTPLGAYRDAAYDFAIRNGCEFLNATDTWGPYGGGLWADTLHLNDAGAAVLADQLNRHFIGV